MTALPSKDCSGCCKAAERKEIPGISWDLKIWGKNVDGGLRVVKATGRWSRQRKAEIIIIIIIIKIVLMVKHAYMDGDKWSVGPLGATGCTLHVTSSLAHSGNGTMKYYTGKVRNGKQNPKPRRSRLVSIHPYGTCIKAILAFSFFRLLFSTSTENGMLCPTAKPRLGIVMRTDSGPDFKHPVPSITSCEFSPCFCKTTIQRFCIPVYFFQVKGETR